MEAGAGELLTSRCPALQNSHPRSRAARQAEGILINRSRPCGISSGPAQEHEA